MSEGERDPMPLGWALKLHLQCGARTRAGFACRQPAMPNGRCKMHGGKSTGPRTAAGLERLREARTKHGCASRELVEFRRAMRRLRVQGRRLIELA